MKKSLTTGIALAVVGMGISGYYIGKTMTNDSVEFDSNYYISEPADKNNSNANNPDKNNTNGNTSIGNDRKVFKLGFNTIDFEGNEVADVSAEKFIYVTNGSGNTHKESLEPKNGSFILSDYEPYCRTALDYLDESEVQEYWKIIKNNPSKGYEEYITQYSDTVDEKVLLGRAMLRQCEYSPDSNVLFTTKSVEVVVQSEGYLEYTHMISEVKLLSGEGFLQVTINPEYKKEVTSEGDGI